MVDSETVKRIYSTFNYEPFNPGPDYTQYLREFNAKRNAELKERLADKNNFFTKEDEHLEVCGEVESHGGKVPSAEDINIFNLNNIGVFSSNELVTIEVEYETRRNPIPSDKKHGGTYVTRVCSEHANSIPRWGIINIRQIDQDAHMEITEKLYPGKVYKAFGLPEAPHIKTK
jgi:hypothetical protein